jgi:hypothetical protein
MTTNISTITMLTADRDPREPHRNLTTDIVGQTAPCARGAVYLSGPMTILYQKSRAALLDYAWFMSEIEGELLKRDWIVYNPYSAALCHKNFDPSWNTKWIEQGEYHMLSCLDQVEKGRADLALWLGGPGWRKSNGAKQEQGFGREHGLELVEGKLKFCTKRLTWRNVAFVGIQ